MQAFNGSDNDGNGSALEPIRGLCAIIARELDRKSISSRSLADQGIIRRRQGFRERLLAARLLPAEIDALICHLEVDLVRAALALAVFADPESYFDILALNLGNVGRALRGAIERQGDALDCAFEPMRPALCAAVADRICQALVQHHARVEQARASLL